MNNVLSVISNSILDRYSRKISTPVLLQIVLLMEQYIKENSELANFTNPSTTDEYSRLKLELSKLEELGLGNTKNAKMLSEKFNTLAKRTEVINNSRNVITFVRELREHFGESTLLIGFKQFNHFIDKHNLEIGGLNQYTGIIPDKNIQEIVAVSNKLSSFKYSYVINKPSSEAYLWKIAESINGAISEAGDKAFKALVKYINKHNGFVLANTDQLGYDGAIRLYNLIRVNPDLPAEVRDYERTSLISLRGNPIDSNSLFIACPSSQLKKQPLRISRRAIDPIVFQYSPHGMIIHSVWGEEAEDKVFEEYKIVNNLLSL